MPDTITSALPAIVGSFFASVLGGGIGAAWAHYLNESFEHQKLRIQKFERIHYLYVRIRTIWQSLQPDYVTNLWKAVVDAERQRHSQKPEPLTVIQLSEIGAKHLKLVPGDQAEEDELMSLAAIYLPWLLDDIRFLHALAKASLLIMADDGMARFVKNPLMSHEEITEFGQRKYFEDLSHLICVMDAKLSVAADELHVRQRRTWLRFWNECVVTKARSSLVWLYSLRMMFSNKEGIDGETSNTNRDDPNSQEGQAKASVRPGEDA